MTTPAPTDTILSNHLKVNSSLSTRPTYYPNNKQDNNNTLEINKESDYWHYDIGANVIPVDSENKRTFFKWKDYQNAPISDKQHELKKKSGDYNNGIAALAGKVWRGIHTDKHLVVIDLDNKKGIDEFIEHCFPNLKTLEGLSRQTIVEQHSDNREKAHVYFIVEKPLTNRGSINGANRNDDSNPIIEIKSEGKSFVICYPSVHKNGYRYEIIGTKAPMVLDWKQSEQLQENINKIYKKYGETETKDNNGLTPISNLLKEDYVSHEGSRHSDLLRIMESYIQRYKEDLDLDEIKKNRA
ncbi:MAG TPA: bifunctional DNA primase/polymerase [Candidatus Nitrosocosmicus sp.]